MSGFEYDEDEVLKRYLMQNARHFMSDFEKRCIHLGILREKAQETGRSKTVADKLWEEWRAGADAEVRQALSDGVVAFQERVQQRLVREYSQGTLPVNRCPSCHRIVRTPLAKQCLWCGHDWHGT